MVRGLTVEILKSVTDDIRAAMRHHYQLVVNIDLVGLYSQLNCGSSYFCELEIYSTLMY